MVAYYELTGVQQQNYIDDGGTHCPICGSEALTEEEFDLDGGSADRLVSCKNCGAEYTEVYVMVSVELISQPVFKKE